MPSPRPDQPARLGPTGQVLDNHTKNNSKKQKRTHPSCGPFWEPLLALKRRLAKAERDSFYDANGNNEDARLDEVVVGDLSSRRIGSILFVPDRGTSSGATSATCPPRSLAAKFAPASCSRRSASITRRSTSPRSPAKPRRPNPGTCRYEFIGDGLDAWVKTLYIHPLHRSRLDLCLVNGRWCAPSLGCDDLARLFGPIASIFAITALGP
jgi:hypothetical protein